MTTLAISGALIVLFLAILYYAKRSGRSEGRQGAELEGTKKALDNAKKRKKIDAELRDADESDIDERLRDRYRD